MARALNKLPKPKTKRQALYFCVQRVMLLETSETVGALVPLTRWDAREMRDRRYSLGSELRALVTKRRNVKFHRLAHAIGALVVDQLPDFAGMKSHDALKRLQREANIFCDMVEIDASPVVAAILAAAQSLLGEVATKMLAAVLPEIKTISIVMPRSMSFDELDEGEFQQLVQAIYQRLSDHYWPDMDPEAVEELVLMYEREH